MAPTAQGLSSVATKETEGAKIDTLDKDSSAHNASLEYIKSLTNLADIQECLLQLELEETKVDADLDELLAEREDLEASLEKLE
ncbi:hypothetical protein BGX27_000789, partial [Mortierella sp. AM989]